MPEVIVGRPFRELELPDQDGLKPAAILHFRCGQPCAPPAALRLGKVSERTFLHLQRPQLLEQLLAGRGGESVTCARDILKLPIVVVAKDQRVEVSVRWCVAANDEFLTPIDLHLLPGAGALAWL